MWTENSDVIHRALLEFVLLLDGRDYLQSDRALRLGLWPQTNTEHV